MGVFDNYDEIEDLYFIDPDEYYDRENEDHNDDLDKWDLNENFLEDDNEQE
jgi:hypothetical protein